MVDYRVPPSDADTHDNMVRALVVLESLDLNDGYVEISRFGDNWCIRIADKFRIVHSEKRGKTLRQALRAPIKKPELAVLGWNTV